MLFRLEEIDCKTELFLMFNSNSIVVVNLKCNVTWNLYYLKGIISVIDQRVNSWT